ncbi:putative methyl-accepting chemotaxis sensory transducer [gamma proteobacterium IMCC1989]|nr:putative methyl-accepting chemotaxis sensory transducer [gamma proteobacterium IMCC1989]
MAVTIDQVSANAAESALVASKSVSIAHNGSKMVQNTIHGMDTIREQIQDTSKRIKRLGESTQEIGDIVSLINDIADQTNILALNAAIQASMAGDAGRGFAVVADEVQRLAERSAGATKQIGSLVKTIQTDTNEAVKSMEQTTTEVVSGARLAQDAGVALEEIEGVSANLAELIQNISNAARQQASSAGHISNTMNVIQEITSQTSAGTGATAHAIGDLADMALELREFVAGFKLPDEMNTAIPFNEEKAARDQAAQPPMVSNNASTLSTTGTAALASAPLAAASMPEETQADNVENDFTHLFEDGHLEENDYSAGNADADDFDNDSFANEVFTSDTATDLSEMNPEHDQHSLMDEPPTLELTDELSVADSHFDVSDEVINLVDNEDVDGLEEEFDLDDLDFIDSKSTEKS